MGWEEIKVLGKFPYLGCEGRHRGRGRTWKKKNPQKLGSYWEVLFQAALWKHSIKLGP